MLALVAWRRAPLLALVSAAAWATLVVGETVTYHELVEPLGVFDDAACVSHSLTLPAASGTASRRVVVSAHLDSAHEFRPFALLGTASIPVLIYGAVEPLVAMVALALGAAFRGCKGLSGRIRWTMAAVTVFTLPFFLFFLGDYVVGASDNLSSVAVLGQLARTLSAERASGALSADAEMVLLATSGEEAGLRGAKRYVEEHAASLLAIDTSVIVLEQCYEASTLKLTPGEVFTNAWHSPWLGAVLTEAAAEAAAEKTSPDYGPLPAAVLPFGATDATPFTHAGVAAAVLSCAPYDRMPPNYHTKLDTADLVEEEALLRMLDVTTRAVVKLSHGGGRRESSEASVDETSEGRAEL